ncbi:hypothetical protein L3X38_011043 [Prunus dulcis]|uniref:DDE Tnp4 domain-containing protein n=1 Tax=Prunus dulcis TaxID=3755 RepID=A0AAD4WIW8_PRUDU|nr:hypothetical protein L3X38_011043 [Prunus dulcis]
MSENTQQVNEKGKSKQDYNAWTVEESRILLQLMVDAASCGWRDANGILSKETVKHWNGLKVPQEVGGQGRAPANEVELFNLRHSSLRNVIERIFGIFKSRFTIFKSAPPFPYVTQTKIVLACVGLHNFLRKECRSDEFPIELEDESSSSSSLPVNEGDLELVFQTQEQQRHNANDGELV